MATPFNDAVEAVVAAHSKEKWHSFTNAEQTRLIYEQIKIMDKIYLSKTLVSEKAEA